MSLCSDAGATEPRAVSTERFVQYAASETLFAKTPSLICRPSLFGTQYPLVGRFRHSFVRRVQGRRGPTAGAPRV
jgi:hypothetical protein